MADKKVQEEGKSVASKITKEPVAKKKDAKIVQKGESKAIKNKATGRKIEPRFPAKDLAEKQGIQSFEFFVIKREANIKNDTLLTAAEMQNLYKKIIKR